MLSAIHRTQATLDPSQPTPEQRTNHYRTPEEIAPLVGEGAEIELLEVEGAYAGFDELWSSVRNGAGPAGAWVKTLDEAQLEAARTELHRQVGKPSGAFTLRGRAWAARVTRA
jgi:hypothetical protein